MEKGEREKRKLKNFDKGEEEKGTESRRWEEGMEENYPTRAGY